MLLMGQDYPDALVPLTTMPGRKGEPYAVKTRLGWTVNGPVTSHRTVLGQKAFFTQGERLEQLDQKIDKFWQIMSSSLYEDNKAMSAQDKLIAARWEDSATYADGHYTLPIPFRHEEPQLSDNREQAQLNKKKARERHTAMRKVYRRNARPRDTPLRFPPGEVDSQDGKVWYLPHYPVVNPKWTSHHMC